MDLDDYLDTFGQQPGLNIYTQITFAYAIADDAAVRSKTISILRGGLSRLTTNFPWVAGQVVGEALEAGGPSVFKIRPLEIMPRLSEIDLTHHRPPISIDTLRRAGFPMSMLNEDSVAPWKTLPSPEELASESPVFAVQASEIAGGLLLTFVGQHQAMDMTGLGQVIYLLSKACRGEEYTSEELRIGNLPRRHIIPLLDEDDDPSPQLDHQINKPVPPIPEAHVPIEDPISPPPECIWANFTFQSSSLATLKTFATETVPSGYVSTDDVITAFIWQSVMRARLSRLDMTTNCTFARAVDPRRYLGIPLTYPGLVQNMVYQTCFVGELMRESLGVLSARFRSAVDPRTSSIGHDTRALATLIDRARDKGVVNVTASLDLGTDIMLSSWAKETCYEFDFGLGLGTPEAVRRPAFYPVESLMYLLPRTLEGDITVAMCLREEDMVRLRNDEDFGKYANYIG